MKLKKYITEQLLTKNMDNYIQTYTSTFTEAFTEMA